MVFNSLQITFISSMDWVLLDATDIHFLPREAMMVIANKDNIISNRVNALPPKSPFLRLNIRPINLTLLKFSNDK
jgi:hypothetical protein